MEGFSPISLAPMPDFMTSYCFSPASPCQLAISSQIVSEGLKPSDFFALNAIFLTPPSWREICQAIPKLFNGELNSLPFVHSVVGDQMLVHTKQYQAFQADGIVLDITGPCQATCMKGALQMIVPKECL